MSEIGAGLIMALSAVSAVAGGYAAKQQGAADNEAAVKNARILEQNAMIKRQETARNADILRAKNRTELSRLRAGLSSAGMLDSTTSLGVLAGQSAVGDDNVNAFVYKGESEAENLLSKAALTRWQGQMAKQAGKTAFQMSFLQGAVSGLAGYMSAGGTFGGGISDMSSAGKAALWSAVPKG